MSGLALFFALWAVALVTLWVSYDLPNMAVWTFVDTGRNGL